MKLDLGCGTAKVKGAIGVDKIPLQGVDVLADLMQFPYPFADDTFDEVYLNDVIEHIPDTIRVMEELFRITRNNARIFIRVVNWNSHYTAMDPTHVKAFTENSFDFYGVRKGRSYYTHARFDVVNVDYQYNAKVQKTLKSTRLMKFLSNYLCNILEGLEFELKTVKSQNDLKHDLNNKNIFNIVRCPYCLGNTSVKNNPEMNLYKKSWLICTNKSCNRKYPVHDGLPILLKKEGDNWKTIKISSLSIPPKNKIRRIIVDE